MRIVIVIPTYNEKYNIVSLIPLIDKELKKYGKHDFSILVVDGNSPDGTGDAIKEVSKKYPYVHLFLEKEKGGIGAAYVNGFKYAMNELSADALIEMDADHQHPPEDLAKLLKAFDEGYDYVIGSRYIKEGSIPKEWAFYRKFLSVGGNIFTKIVLGIFNVNDFTTGFKLARVKGFVDKIDLDAINSSSFAYKTDLLFKMHKLGAKIKEVPLKFGLRDRGESKLEGNNVFDFLKVVLLIRYEASKNFIRFFATGLIGLAVDTGLFTLFRLTLLSSAFASASSGFIAMLTTYLINNYWSFGERKLSGVKKNISSMFVYFASSYVPILFRSWLIDYTSNTFGSGPLIVYGAFFVGVFVGLIWNYTVYSKIIWRKKV